MQTSRNVLIDLLRESIAGKTENLMKEVWEQCRDAAEVGVADGELERILLLIDPGFKVGDLVEPGPDLNVHSFYEPGEFQGRVEEVIGDEVVVDWFTDYRRRNSRWYTYAYAFD